MKYIKLFDNHSKYEEFLESEEYVTPYAVWCNAENEGHLHKFVETRIVARLNVSGETSSDVQIVGYFNEGGETYDATVLFESIEIDGKKVDLTQLENGSISLSSGNHIIKYTFIDETTLGNGAFYNCTGLTSIEIPSNMTSIGHAAFDGCTGLTSIDIPSGVTSIGNGAFNSCTGLTSIEIPSGVTTIGQNTFYGCTGLTSITIPSSVTSIGNYAFYGCTGLTSITIPSSVTTIGDYALRDCTGLTSITIPSSVTTLGTNAFCGCTGLTAVNGMEGVTTIGSGAFAICRGLTSIEIPSGVTSIDGGAFEDCTGLTSIKCTATTPPTLGTNAFRNTNDCPIYVQRPLVDTYKAANGWSAYASRIEGYAVFEYVDMGLPSGTLWAKCNLGAESETDNGLLYQWADTQGYTESQVGSGSGQKYFDTFDWTDYKFADTQNHTVTKYNENDNKDEIELSDDAANVALEDNWCIPHPLAFNELNEYTTKSLITRDNVDGILLTSTENGNTLFFPFAKQADNGELITFEVNYAAFWTSWLGTKTVLDWFNPNTVYSAYGFDFYADDNGGGTQISGEGYDANRPVGKRIRPVIYDENYTWS